MVPTSPTALADVADQLAQQGDWAGAREFLTEAVRLDRAGGDRSALWTNTQNLGIAELRSGDFAASRQTFERSLEIAKGLNDLDAVAMATFQLGRAAQKERDFLPARETFERAASLFSQAGDRQLRGESLAHAARIRYDVGDLEGALQTLAEAWLDMPSNSPMAEKWRGWLADEKQRQGAGAYAALLAKLHIAPGTFEAKPEGRRWQDRRP